MAYVFENQTVGKATVTDENQDSLTLGGINGAETDANIIMAGISYLYDIAGWTVDAASRNINQSIVEE